MLPQRELARTLFPVGHLTKAEVRRRADAAGLRTAHKPDSQDVCFITHTGGREQFLGDRIPFRPARVVDADGVEVGAVGAVELVTIGQRRGIGLPGGGPKRYVVDVDVAAARVVVGDERELYVGTTRVAATTWAAEVAAGEVLVQCSAHGEVRRAAVRAEGSPDEVVLDWFEPQRRVAPGQSVVLYDLTNERVLGGGIAG
jgi:tRNA-specific 2-thiouridylase